MINVPHEIIEYRSMIHGVCVRPVPDAIRKEFAKDVISVDNFTYYWGMFRRECNMPGIGGLVNRSGEAVRRDEGEVEVGQIDKTIYKAWVEELVSSLQLVWEITALRAHENSAGGGT